MMAVGHVIAGMGFVLMLLNRTGAKWDDPKTNSGVFWCCLAAIGVGETLAWGIYTWNGQ